MQPMKTSETIYWLDRLIESHLVTYPAEYRSAVSQAIDILKRMESERRPWPANQEEP